MPDVKQVFENEEFGSENAFEKASRQYDEEMESQKSQESQELSFNYQENEQECEEYLEPVNSLAESEFIQEIDPEHVQSEIVQTYESNEAVEPNFDQEIETAFTFSPEKVSEKLSSSKTTESTLTYQATMDGTLCHEEIEEFTFEYKSPRQTLVPKEFQASDLNFPSDEAPVEIKHEWVKKTTSLTEIPAISRNSLV